MKSNTPYKKQYNLAGQCINEITQDKPYVNIFQNRKQKRKRIERFLNNRNTFQMVVFSTFRYIKKVQTNSGKTINHLLLA
jgi:hypothetical protein